MKELGEIEDAILRRFTVGNESLFAGVITTGNMREFVLYTSDEVGAVAKAQQLAKEIRHHQVQFVVNDDPEWNVFKQFSAR
jgi:thiamine monophosphate synthase